MDRVTILAFGVASDWLGRAPLTLEIAPGSRVLDALERLEDRFPALAGVRPRLRFAVNQQYATLETPLGAGDELAIIPPVSGG